MKSQDRKILFLVICLKTLQNCFFFRGPVTSILTFSNVLVTRQTIPTLLVILSFMNFFVAQASISLFFIVEKLNISAIHKGLLHPNVFQWIFLWYLSTSFIERNSNLTTRRTSRTTSRWSLTRNIEIEI